jgi:hypothetical protein
VAWAHIVHLDTSGNAVEMFELDKRGRLVNPIPHHRKKRNSPLISPPLSVQKLNRQSSVSVVEAAKRKVREGCVFRFNSGDEEDEISDIEWSEIWLSLLDVEESEGIGDVSQSIGLTNGNRRCLAMENDNAQQQPK